MPKALCSWEFNLTDGAHGARLSFNWVGEEGWITADGTTYRVHKHGMSSGRWTLDRDEEELAAAQKCTPLTREFELETPEGSFVLSAERALGRAFGLRRGEQRLATFTPVHAFTRRARITTVEGAPDFLTLAFSFWLVVLMWRRASRNSG